MKCNSIKIYFANYRWMIWGAASFTEKALAKTCRSEDASANKPDLTTQTLFVSTVMPDFGITGSEIACWAKSRKPLARYSLKTIYKVPQQALDEELRFISCSNVCLFHFQILKVFLCNQEMIFLESQLRVEFWGVGVGRKQFITD